MIPFKMNILNYNAGVYTVEYVPDDKNCTPVKLDIKLDQHVLNDANQVLNRLKISSPQEYWHQEMAAMSIQTNDVLKTLVNTTHVVRNLEHVSQVNPVTTFPPLFRHQVTTPRVDDLSSVPIPEQATQVSDPTPSNQGVSSPEQIATRNEQNIIRMKILIQQVLQEMADGTV